MSFIRTIFWFLAWAAAAGLCLLVVAMWLLILYAIFPV